ncbi:carbohydrate-binding domain-containing protein [Fibrobacter succinogenes]|uniref:carbohydrate-binding domain-containing protein n=1 Tax=Fibrobacter succinogenes TaxID=833 RepID=UPI0013D0E58A|nr:carbohydrate-binding domain-containing protein [Fibrobacter succinogenes]
MNKNAKMRVGLALPVALLMAANSWGATKSVSYIDEDGKEKTHDCTVLDTNTNISSLSSGGWYVVEGSLSYTSQLKSSGNLYFILADGASLNVSGSKTNLIEATNVTIYGQREQTGSMNLNQSGKKDGILSISFDPDGRAFYVSSLTVNGGIINATTSGTDAICATHDVTINGGSVYAVTTGGSSYHGIKSGCSLASSGTITLGWRNLTDNIYVSSYSGSVSVVSGKALKDESANKYEGTLTSSAIKGKLLMPYAPVVFVGDKAIIDGNYSGSATVNIPEAIEVGSIEYQREFDNRGLPATTILPFTLPDNATFNAKFYGLRTVVQDGCQWRAKMKYIGDGNRPAANTPYIVVVKAGDTSLNIDLKGDKATFQTSGNNEVWGESGNWLFAGNYSYRTWKDDANVNLYYALFGEGDLQGKFGKVSTSSTAPAMRAYFRKKDADVKIVCSSPSPRPAAFGESAIISDIPEIIDVELIDDDEDGEHTTFVGRMNTRTGELFQMKRDYDLKGRKLNGAPTARGAYYGKKVIKK